MLRASGAQAAESSFLMTRSISAFAFGSIFASISLYGSSRGSIRQSPYGDREQAVRGRERIEHLARALAVLCDLRVVSPSYPVKRVLDVLDDVVEVGLRGLVGDAVFSGPRVWPACADGQLQRTEERVKYLALQHCLLTGPRDQFL